MMIAALANAGDHARASRPGSRWRARAFDFIAREHDARATGSAIPGAKADCSIPALASDFASMIRAALALYEATGQGGLSRAGADLAARVRRALRQSGQWRLFPHRRRRRRAGGAPGLDQRRRHAQSERRSPRRICPARGADRRRRSGASRPTGCSTACWRARPTTCCSTRHCSTRSTCVCTRPRSSSPGRSTRALPRPR